MSAAPRPAGAVSDYDLLVALAERELVLVDTGEWDDLDALTRARDALVARLPATPPAHARPALERAAALQAEVTRRLTAARDAATAELGRLARGRHGVRLYTPAAATPTLVDCAG